MTTSFLNRSVLCTDIALQRTFFGLKICSFSPGRDFGFYAGQQYFDCATWYDFTATDEELGEDGDELVHVDCSSRFVFDGRASSTVKELIFPDGCDNDSFVFWNQDEPQRIVLEGALEREIIYDTSALFGGVNNDNEVLIEVPNPFDNGGNAPLEITYAQMPLGGISGAIRTRTVPNLDGGVDGIIVSVCVWISDNRPRVNVDEV